MYIDNAKKEYENMMPLLTPELKHEMNDAFADIADMDETITDMITDFEISCTRFVAVFKEYLPVLQKKLQTDKDQLTKLHEGLSITRQVLTYSSFAISAGYDAANSTMDIDFGSGVIYRYLRVPKEFFDKIMTIKSLKGVRAELNSFEFKKLE